jgi:hypothetical protein
MVYRKMLYFRWMHGWIHWAMHAAGAVYIYIYTVNGHKYSSPSISCYIFHIKPHFSKKYIVKSFLNGF